MLILELLSDAYPYTDRFREYRGIKVYTADFIAGDRMIRVDIGEKEGEQGQGHWEMAFEERHSDRPSSLGVTGSGDEFKVFATVIKITKNFMRDHDVQTLSFTAEKSEGNRARLYQRMVDRLTPPGWKKRIDHRASDYRSYFTIERGA